MTGRGHGRGARDADYYSPDQFGEMLVSCGCEATFVRVAKADIDAGRTRSCGRPECRGPDVMAPLTKREQAQQRKARARGRPR